MFKSKIQRTLILTLFLLINVLGFSVLASVGIRCEALFISNDEKIKQAVDSLALFRAETIQAPNAVEKQRLLEIFDHKFAALLALVKDEKEARRLMDEAILKNPNRPSYHAAEKRQVKERTERLEQEQTEFKRWEKFSKTAKFLQRFTHGFKLTHDGSKMVTFSTQDRNVKIFDTETLKQIQFPDQTVNNRADHFLIAEETPKLFLYDKWQIKIWDLDTMSYTIEKNILESPIYRIRVSSDGLRILTSNNVGQIKLYDVPSKSEIPLHLDNEDMDDMVLSKDGSQVVTTDLNEVVIYDTRTEKTVRFSEPTANAAKVKQILRSPDNKLWVLNEKNILYCYDFDSGARSVLDFEKRDIINVEFSRDGSKLLLAGRDFITKMDLKNQTQDSETYPMGANPFLGNTVSTPDLGWIVTNFQGHFKAMDSRLSEMLHPFNSQTFDTIAAHPDGKRFFMTDAEGALYIWFLNEADFDHYEARWRAP